MASLQAWGRRWNVVKLSRGDVTLFSDCHLPKYLYSASSFITEKTMKRPRNVLRKKSPTLRHPTTIPFETLAFETWSWPATGETEARDEKKFRQPNGNRTEQPQA